MKNSPLKPRQFSANLNFRFLSFKNEVIKSFLFFFLATLLIGCEGGSPIINGVDERDANEIVVFLASKGITADKVPAATSAGVGGSTTSNLWNIVVDSSQSTEAMSILNRNGLPRRQGQNLLDLFADSGLVPTEMQQKIRYQAGLAQQITNTIRQIDGVIDANVQLSFPQDDSTTQPITASVYVKHQGVLDNPNSQLVTKIKQLVAGSVTGLKLENVTVVADRSRFTDVSLGTETQGSTEEKEYLSIWSVIVAKESVGRFRAILFTLFLMIFLLACLLAWLIWKCYPLIIQRGGWKEFFNLKPIEVVPKDKKEDSTPDSKE